MDEVQVDGLPLCSIIKPARDGKETKKIKELLPKKKKKKQTGKAGMDKSEKKSKKPKPSKQDAPKKPTTTTKESGSKSKEKKKKTKKENSQDQTSAEDRPKSSKSKKRDPEKGSSSSSSTEEPDSKSKPKPKKSKSKKKKDSLDQKSTGDEPKTSKPKKQDFESGSSSSSLEPDSKSKPKTKSKRKKKDSVDQKNIEGEPIASNPKKQDLGGSSSSSAEESDSQSKPKSRRKKKDLLGQKSTENESLASVPKKPDLEQESTSSSSKEESDSKLKTKTKSKRKKKKDSLDQNSTAEDEPISSVPKKQELGQESNNASPTDEESDSNKSKTKFKFIKFKGKKKDISDQSSNSKDGTAAETGDPSSGTESESDENPISPIAKKQISRKQPGTASTAESGNIKSREMKAQSAGQQGSDESIWESDDEPTTKPAKGKPLKKTTKKPQQLSSTESDDSDTNSPSRHESSQKDRPLRSAQQSPHHRHHRPMCRQKALIASGIDPVGKVEEEVVIHHFKNRKMTTTSYSVETRKLERPPWNRSTRIERPEERRVQQQCLCQLRRCGHHQSHSTAPRTAVNQMLSIPCSLNPPPTVEEMEERFTMPVKATDRLLVTPCNNNPTPLVIEIQPPHQQDNMEWWERRPPPTLTKCNCTSRCACKSQQRVTTNQDMPIQTKRTESTFVAWWERNQPRPDIRRQY